jgi:glyoxylase-like metal-dependent hydrolase (beta-lactamase superfamily II)
MSHWRLGDITVDRVIEQERPLMPPSVLYPTSAPEAWATHRAWLEPTLLDPASGLLIMSIHSFVVRTRHHTIIVDTCGGNDKPRPQKPRYHQNSYPYLERLAAVGVTPESVDYVLFTHLHVDHVDGTLVAKAAAVPTFLVRSN